MTSFASEEMSAPLKKQRGVGAGEDDAVYWVHLKEGEVSVSKNFFEGSRGETRAGAITYCTAPSVTSLDLTDSGFGSSVLEIVSRSLMNNAKLQTLSLGSNSLCPRSVDRLMGGILKAYVPLQVLDLSFCTLGRGNVQIIADFLAPNQTLKSLDLEGNMIGDAGAISIARNLCGNTSLKELYLAGNSVGVETAKAFGAMLRRNMSLEVLCLGNCKSVPWNENEIGDKGAEFIAEGLVANRTLRCLYLSLNNIGGRGALSIMDALKVNTTLTDLDLSCNFIDVIGSSLKENRGLEKLNLRWNSLGIDEMQSLIDDYLRRESFRFLNVEKKKKRERADLKKLISEKNPSGKMQYQDGWIVKVA